MKTNTKLTLTLILANLLDFATTSLLVHKFGVLAEANPLVAYFILKFGILGILLVKLPSLTLIWFLKDYIRKSILYILNIIYFTVVIYNIWVCYNTL